MLGAPRIGVFVRLMNWVRNSKFVLSEIWNALTMLRSEVANPGPRNAPAAQVPNVLGVPSVTDAGLRKCGPSIPGVLGSLGLVNCAAPGLRNAGDAVWTRRSAAGKRRVCAVRIQRKAGMHSKVRRDAPSADHRIDHRVRASAKPAAFSKGQVIHQIPIEETGGIGDAAPIVAFGVVGILEEEPKAGLADDFREALPRRRTGRSNPGCCSCTWTRYSSCRNCKPCHARCSTADLQGVIALNAAGIVEAYRRGVARAATVDQRLGKRSR